MPRDPAGPRPPGKPVYRPAGTVAAILDEAEKTVPIGAEAAVAQIEAMLRLLQQPGRDIFVMVGGIALAAAITIDRRGAAVSQP